MTRETCDTCNETGLVSEMYELEGSYICKECVHLANRLGAHEQYHVVDPEWNDLIPLATCLILENWASNSSEDEYMSNEGWGYCGRFGKYLFFHDTQGFRSYGEFSNDAEAAKEFDRLYKDGWGADEYDAYIEDGRGYTVTFEGKTLDIWGRGKYGHPVRPWEGVDLKRCIARVRLEAMKTGYYPNLWHISDHGNLSLIPY